MQCPQQTRPSTQLRGLGHFRAPVSTKHKGIFPARNRSQSTRSVPQKLVGVGLGQQGDQAILSLVAILTAGMAWNPIHAAAAAPAGVSWALGDDGGEKRSGQRREQCPPPPQAPHRTHEARSPTWALAGTHSAAKNDPQPQLPDGGSSQGLSGLSQHLQLCGLYLPNPRPRAAKDLMNCCIFGGGQRAGGRRECSFHLHLSHCLPGHEQHQPNSRNTPHNDRYHCSRMFSI